MPQLRPASTAWRTAREEEQQPLSRSLQKFRLYETRQRFYLIGSDPSKKYWRVLKIDRSEASELNVSEDPVSYSQQECKDLLQRIADGNRATGGLTFITKAFGIAGCIKFLESYYLILVTKRRQIGSICGHAIYAIDESQMITIPHTSVQTDLAYSKAELRYKKLLSGVDLTKDFYFSYTYPIMQCLQRNVLGDEADKFPYENMFVWNAFLTCSIHKRLNNTLWTIALVHGYFEQVKMSIFGCIFVITLISRRSRHFAGTRYLKRGVSDKGRVANDVETEQIVSKEECRVLQLEMSSIVQMRGSIPLFWSQEASRLSPKPDIILQRYDPTYQATRLHFEDVAKRYGHPTIILNLIKTVEKRPREMMLRREFAIAIGYLNQILPKESCIQFIHWDFHKFAKSKSANVLAVLGAVASQALDLIDIYYSGKRSVVKRGMHQQSLSCSSRENVAGKPSDFKASLDKVLVDSDILDFPNSKNNETVESCFKQPPNQNDGNEKERTPRLQSGVLRTNCIDCLDRTNVAQYAYGLVALGRQLLALGLADTDKLDPDSSIAEALMKMYQNMGDALALQYGGSAAHNTVFPERQGKWKATTQSQEFLKSIKRYYSNTYTDGEKQDAINLFLGYFQPEEGKPALWELDSDYYLHVGSNGDEFYGLDARSLLETSSKMMEVWRTGVLPQIMLGKCDPGHLKLTSFDKLIQAPCGSVKNVRMFVEPDTQNKASASVSGTAPDAAEIQLKSPVWLYGQQKQQSLGIHNGCKEDNLESSKRKRGEPENHDFSWLFSSINNSEKEIFQSHLMIDNIDENSWYGSGFLQSLEEDNEAYQHYAQCLQAINLDPFDRNGFGEDGYDKLLREMVETNNEDVMLSLDNLLNDYVEVGKDLGISVLNKNSLEDPSILIEWILKADCCM